MKKLIALFLYLIYSTVLFGQTMDQIKKAKEFVKKTGMSEKQVIKEAKSEFNVVILKIPHGSSKKQLDFYCNTCADFLHISNSKKTNQGSISGRSLIDQNLLDIIYIKEKHNDSIKIIAGGGIYYFEDLVLYKKAGADYFSLSTCLLNPFRTYNIIKKSQYL